MSVQNIIGTITAIPQCGAIVVRFDFSREILARVKAINCRKVYNPTDKCWLFDIKDLAIVRKALPDFLAGIETFNQKFEAYK